MVVTHSPKVILKDYKGNTKYEFSHKFNSAYPSGMNLLSYSFQKSISNFTSQWNISIKEDPNSSNRVFDVLEGLDVVEIYETDKNTPDYIGIVVNISYSAQSKGQKIINVSGYGIEWLFEYITISLDATAMAFLGKFVELDSTGIMTQLTLNGLDSSGEAKNVNIAEAVKVIYKSFTEAVNGKAKDLSNSDIVKMLEKWFTKDFVIDKGLKFQYPIASNMFRNSTISMLPYIRNLLPENAYEIYLYMNNGKPKMMIRENPFDLNSSGWFGLPSKQIKAEVLTDYTLTRSINEVYTAFYSYIEGSELSQDMSQKIFANDKGYGTAERSSKLSKYGYKPLCVNFVGFNTEYCSNSKVKSSMQNKIKKLNERIKVWYENLDEMYDATIGMVVVPGVNYPAIGERALFLDGEFYVTGEDHQWNYGGISKLILHCERGGSYKNNKFSCLKNITKKLAELENLK